MQCAAYGSPPLSAGKAWLQRVTPWLMHMKSSMKNPQKHAKTRAKLHGSTPLCSGDYCRNCTLRNSELRHSYPLRPPKQDLVSLSTRGLSQHNFQLPLMTAKFHSLNPSVSVRDWAILKIPRSSSRPSRLLNYDNLRELNAVSAKCSG